MVKKKMGRPRLEYEIRTLQITKVEMFVTYRIEDRHSYGPPGDAWLKVDGTLDETLEGQTTAEISIHELEKADRHAPDRPKSIGALIQTRPRIQILIDLPGPLFERTWTMASGGKLLHIWISMTKPVRQHAHVLSVSLQNEPVE